MIGLRYYTQHEENTMNIQYYVKAVYAAAVGFLGQLVIVLVGDTTFAQITNGQWVTSFLFALLAFGGILGWQSASPTISTSIK